MKIFWPHRSDAKGFSIKNLASKYREKISRLSSNKIQNQISYNRNIKFMQEEGKKVEVSNLCIKKGHWANRDFSEYKQAA